MADAADTKYVALKSERVQVPPPAQALYLNGYKAFLLSEKKLPRILFGFWGLFGFYL